MKSLNLIHQYFIPTYNYHVLTILISNIKMQYTPITRASISIQMFNNTYLLV